MMKTMLCVVALFWSLGPQFAWANDADKCREVLQANFQATNEENMAALMATISPRAPGCDRFEQEATEAFEDIDVYLRLEGFQVIGRQGDMLAARVIQSTMAKPEDHDNGTEQQINYRRYTSALLPEYEKVEYTQTFRREGGKWRLWLIDGVPQRVGNSAPIGSSAEHQTNVPKPVSGPRSVFGNGCANGRCRVQ
jgi:hypothetical protein